ncbi:MAG: YihY/virulence factor BrkB family protein [Phycisphaeraceae bacterium]|nr:YihY/virulence factor BrkB family protein [Phycisphaeraceae bacterium]MCW5763812.1 YihY/virulence factor BrkB family protein [Phycisphaeraceae bacterium]
MPPKTPPRRKPSLLARITHEREELQRAVEVMRDALRGLYRTQIPRMAAALAYRTIFGIVPTCVILLVVFGAIVSDTDIERGLGNILEYTKLNELVVDIAEENDTSFNFSFDFGQMPISTPGDVPSDAESSGERLEAWISELVTRIRSVPKKTIGFISAMILVYAAIGMLVEVERAFNHVFRCVTGRSWWTRVTLYWTMLTLGMLLLAATFIVGNRFRAWVIDVDTEGAFGWLRVNVLGFLATVAISATLLTIAYMRIPNTRVHLRPALIGAIVAAILWEAGKWGFTHYIAFSTNYARLYGSLALIPIFLLWVYVTWLTVLFGLQVAYAMQIVGTNGGRPQRSEDTGPLVAEPRLILTIASAIVQDFERGEPVTIGHVAETSGVPEPLAAIMVRALHEGGYLHEVAGDHDEPVYALSRSPSAIQCRDLVKSAMALVPYTSTGPLSAMRDAELAAFGDTTLDKFQEHSK